MNQCGFRFAITRALPLLLLSIFVMGTARAANDECGPAGGYAFVCGPIAAEDLVLVPGTKWIIASGIEVSADEQEIYIATSGGFKVIAYSRGNPPASCAPPDY